MKAKIQEKSHLLTVLQQLSPDSSKNSLKSWVEQGRVSIDGILASKAHLELQPGQEVFVAPAAVFADRGIKILYEDRDVIVIDKPDRLLSVATDFEIEKTVHAILKRRLKKVVYPVHRLDKDTSGVMIFAISIKARDHLKDQFMKHSIERVYYAFVEGTPDSKKGTWKSTLAEDDFYFVKSGKEGKLAITHYEVIQKYKATSLLKFKLETGRKNQIRVHASEAGYPIVGDAKYGAQSARRLCLHAHILGFVHPIKNKKMRFISPVPFLT